jgi:hypothetical protein
VHLSPSAIREAREVSRWRPHLYARAELVAVPGVGTRRLWSNQRYCRR